jgi:predicted nucleic acid-binding protein
MIVLDTNVTSELMRASPDPRVVDWVRGHRPEELCTTAITLAEIGYGIERLPNGRRKTRLRVAASEVFRAFPDRVLAFDASAALHYARIVDRRERAGAPIDGFDAQIAAICRAQDASLATRNVRDFLDTGLDVLNPFS